MGGAGYLRTIFCIPNEFAALLWRLREVFFVFSLVMLVLSVALSLLNALLVVKPAIFYTFSFTIFLEAEAAAV